MFTRSRKKQILQVATNLMEDSIDKMRDAAGGSYTINSDKQLEFQESPGEPDPDWPSYWTGGDKPYLKSIVTSLSDDWGNISDGLVYYNFSIPLLLIGDENYIADDLEWETIIKGGTYSTKTYPGLYTTDVFSGYTSEMEVAYEQLDAKMISTLYFNSILAGFTETAILECRYNSYLPIFEERASDRSIAELPNIYLMSLASMDTDEDGYGDSMKAYSQDIINCVHLGGWYGPQTIAQLLDISEVVFPWPAASAEESYAADILADYPNLYYDHKHFINKYYRLWSSYIPPAESREVIKQRMQNIILDVSNASFMRKPNPDLIPYYTEIVLPTPESPIETSSPILQIENDIASTGLRNVLLYHIKNKFVDGNPLVQNCMRSAMSDGINPDQYTTAMTDWGITADAEFSVALAEAVARYGTDTATLSAEASTYEEAASVALKYIDLSSILLEEINNPKFVGDDMILLSEDPIQIEMLKEDEGTSNYRYLRTAQAVSFLNSTMANVNEFFVGLMSDVSTGGRSTVLPQLFDSAGFQLGDDGTGDLTQGHYNNLNKVIAFRIEKVGMGIADNGTQQETVLQNIYTLAKSNTAKPTFSSLAGREIAEIVEAHIDDTQIDPEQFIYYDTQVKYGESYRYDVYAYELDLSFRYSYRDYKVSQYTASDEDVTTGLQYNCLVFNNPVTGEDTPLRWLSMPTVVNANHEYQTTNALGNTDGPLEAYATGVGHSVAKSPHKFVCELMLLVEPCLKLYEIPLYSKEVSIVDNPPRQVDVKPFQRKDNSQVIGFFARHESFTEALYPSSLNEEELSLKTRYLNSKSYLGDEKISLPSVSALRYLEVFRMEEIPKRIEDFNGHQVAQIDLKLDHANIDVTTAPEIGEYQNYVDENLGSQSPDTGEFSTFKAEWEARNSGTITSANPDYVEGGDYHSNTQVSSTYFYEEKIQTNKNYYYIFRFLNEHMMPGRFSPIHVLKLVDDGGYKYLETEIILESELMNKSKYSNPSATFKKLFQLLPNIDQVRLNTSQADFGQNAYEQMGNIIIGATEDLIWDKSFKIRLTSIKTGEKIDLNVTYKIKDSL